MKVLALAVLTEALSDLVNPRYYADGGSKQKKARKREKVIEDAKEFFFSPQRAEDLAAWCEAAGLPVDLIKDRAHKVWSQEIDIIQLEELREKEEEANAAVADEPDPDALSGGLFTPEQLDGFEQS